MCSTTEPSPMRLARRAAGMTITELAAAVGVSGQHLYGCESGARRASDALMNRISEALDVPIEELDGRSPFIDPLDRAYDAGFAAGFDEGYEHAKAEEAESNV